MPIFNLVFLLDLWQDLLTVWDCHVILAEMFFTFLDKSIGSIIHLHYLPAVLISKVSNEPYFHELGSHSLSFYHFWTEFLSDTFAAFLYCLHFLHLIKESCISIKRFKLQANLLTLLPSWPRSIMTQPRLIFGTIGEIGESHKEGDTLENFVVFKHYMRIFSLCN
jgi:hypothetical protein